MSLFQQLGDGSLDQILAKRLVTPGGAVAPSVQPELVPALVLENDRPEWLFLSGQAAYGRNGTVAAGGAGTRSSLTLLNQSRSTLAVVERISAVAASGTVLVRIGFQGFVTTPFGTQDRGVQNDTRGADANTPSSNTRRSSLLMITDNTLGSVANNIIWQSLGTSLELAQPFVIGPGGFLYISAGADNVALSLFSVWWRERFLNQGERL